MDNIIALLPSLSELSPVKIEVLKMQHKTWINTVAYLQKAGITANVLRILDLFMLEIQRDDM